MVIDTPSRAEQATVRAADLIVIVWRSANCDLGNRDDYPRSHQEPARGGGVRVDAENNFDAARGRVADVSLGLSKDRVGRHARRRARFLKDAGGAGVRSTPGQK